MDLRPYQKQLITDAKRALARGKRRICIVLSCGGGKSVIAANSAKMAISKRNSVLFLVHRIELCNQIRDTFVACGVKWASEIENFPIQVTSKRFPHIKHLGIWRSWRRLHAPG